MSKIPRILSYCKSCLSPLTTELARLRMNEHTFMVLVAIVIGVLGGFGAIFFRFAIRFFQKAFFGTWQYTLDYALQLPWYIKLAAPAVGGLLVGPIVFYFAREAKGHGVPEVMESIVLRGGAIRPRVMIAKVIASAISIGSGGSVGREGPIVQIGSAIGSVIGQLFKVTGTQLRTFVGCGTAAGIAATFNAPIAGTLFAMEVILRDFGVSQFSPIVVASVSATVVSRHFLGDFSAFTIPSYELVSVYEMIPYVFLGALSAFAALAFINILYKTEDLFERIRIPDFLKPVLGGIIIGAIGIFYPHIFGVGYDSISMALNGQLVWHLLLLLIGLKIVATAITIGSGGSGGVFAPSLFIGASLGGFIGTIVHTLFPLHTASSGAYALVGMGAVAAGVMHAPITSILILFELTNDYRIILPLMLSCIVSVLITTRLKKDSIYTLKLSRRGINMFQGQDINVLHSLPVSRVLKTDYEEIDVDTPFRKLVDLTVNSPHPNFFVSDRNARLLGAVSVHDVRKLINESETLETLVVAYDVMTPIRHHFTPTDTLDMVMKAFGEVNMDQLPVVEEESKKQLIGTVSKHDIIEIYNQEIFKRDMVTSVSGYISSLRKFRQVELMDGQVLSEIEVPGGFVNKTLQELDLRNCCSVEVILIKQHYDIEKEERQKVIRTRPDYRFKLGDRILIISSKDSLNRMRDLNRR